MLGQGADWLRPAVGHVLSLLGHLWTARGLRPATVKAIMSGVASTVSAASGDFRLRAPLVQRVLQGMQVMTGKQVQAPAIVPHEWLFMVD